MSVPHITPKHPVVFDISLKFPNVKVMVMQHKKDGGGGCSESLQFILWEPLIIKQCSLWSRVVADQKTSHSPEPLVKMGLKLVKKKEK